MNSLSFLHDSRNENYVLFHLALLVFTITVMIPINLKLTTLAFPVPVIILAIGFIPLFMIARNEKVGLELIKTIRFSRNDKSFKSLYDVNHDSRAYEKMQNVNSNLNDNYQDPIILLENFVNELHVRHKENMDLATLDSFRILSVKLSEMRLKSNAK